MYKTQCSRTFSIKTLTGSEHIPPPILQVKAFQIFLSSIFTFPFPQLSLSRKTKTKKPGTAAVPKIAKSKLGHNCRACFFPNFPFPFNLQRSPSAIFLITSTAFAGHWETQKSRKKRFLSVWERPSGAQNVVPNHSGNSQPMPSSLDIGRVYPGCTELIEHFSK